MVVCPTVSVKYRGVLHKRIGCHIFTLQLQVSLLVWIGFGCVKL